MNKKLDDIYSLLNDYLGNDGVYAHKLTRRQIVSELQGRVVDIMQLTPRGEDSAIVFLDAVLARLSRATEQESDLVLSVIYEAVKQYRAS